MTARSFQDADRRRSPGPHRFDRGCLSLRLRQRVRHRGAARARCRSAATRRRRCPYGLYAEQLSRHRVHRAARRQPPLLALPHPPGGDAPAVRAHRRRPHRRATSTRVPTPPNQLRWDPLPMPTHADRFRRRACVTMAGNGDPQAQTGCGDPRLCRQPLDDRARVLQRRRRAADRAAAGPAALRHRAGRASTPSRRRSSSSRAACASASSCSTAAARGYVCENFGAAFRLPDLGADRLERPRQPARLPDAGRRVRGPSTAARAGREVPGQPVGGRDGPLAARRRRLARQLRALQVRPAPLQRDRLDQLRPSRSVDLPGAARAVRHAPASTTSTS